MTKAILSNIIAFLERVSVTGRESFAWAEAYAALQEELKKQSEPPSDGA